jgi:hypothetical protein
MQFQGPFTKYKEESPYKPDNLRVFPNHAQIEVISKDCPCFFPYEVVNQLKAPTNNFG